MVIIMDMNSIPFVSNLLGNFLPLLIGIIVFLIIFLILLARHQRTKAISNSLHLGFIQVRLARENAKEQNKEIAKDFKEAISVMEQMLISLTSFKKERISLEIAATATGISFYVVAPQQQLSNIEKLIVASYPEAYVEQVPDYQIFQPDTAQAACLLKQAEGVELPLRIYKEQDS